MDAKAILKLSLTVCLVVRTVPTCCCVLDHGEPLDAGGVRQHCSHACALHIPENTQDCYCWTCAVLRHVAEFPPACTQLSDHQMPAVTSP